MPKFSLEKKNKKHEVLHVYDRSSGLKPVFRLFSVVCAVVFVLTKSSAYYFSIATWKNKQTNKQIKQTKNKKLPSALFLKHLIKISISTSLNISTVSAVNRSLQEIMRSAACSLLLCALGVANVTEDQVING